jgi:subtilisin-like proprotein convertase family protein
LAGQLAVRSTGAQRMDKAIFQNEFAMVEVRRAESVNGVRLLIRDLATGHHIYLNPLELEALTRLHHSFFIHLVAPATREETAMEDSIA